MVAGDAPAAVARPGTHRALLRAFLEAQLEGERPFRSLELFLESAPAAGTDGAPDGPRPA